MPINKEKDNRASGAGELPPSPNGDTSLGKGGFWRLPWSRLSKGDLSLCGWVSCFSNPLDSRKARGLGLRAGAGALPLYPRRG